LVRPADLRAAGEAPRRPQPARSERLRLHRPRRSEEMIFRHYRTWIPGLTPDAGAKVSRILSGGGGGHPPPSASPVASQTPKSTVETQRKRLLDRVEAGGIEPRTKGSSSEPRTEKTRTYHPRLSREHPPSPAIWAPGAQN